MKASSFFTALGAVMLCVLALAPNYHLGLMTFAGIDALAAIGLVLLMRAGQVSLGHAAFIGLGAYGAAILSRDFGWSPWLCLLAGSAIAAAAAAPIGLVTLRLRGTYLPLATLAWGIAIHVVFMASELTGASSGFDRIPPLAIAGTPIGSRAIGFLVWFVVLLAALGGSRLLRSRQGRVLRSLEEHEAVATSFGVPAARLKMVVFVLSAAFAGLAGALYAFQARFISPAPFGVGASFTLLIVVMLGGVTHPVGAVIGALTVGLINLLLQTLFSGLVDRIGPIEPVIFGALLVGLLLRWPGGIWSALAPRLTGSRTTPPPADVAPLPGTDANAAPATGPGAVPLLELINVDKRFGGVRALSGLSLKVPTGAIVGLIGPNGAGKSTAFNMMSGLSQPSSGEVCLRGESLPPAPHRVVGLGLARTFQHVKLVGDMRVIDNVAIGAYWRGNAGVLAGLTGFDRQEERRTMAVAHAALARVGLAGLADAPAGSLPLGRQRLVEIARALAAAPSLLLLDEPAAGLRAAEKQELIALARKLQSEGMSIVLVEHDMQLVMTCVDSLVVLNQGSVLAEGTPAEVRSNRRVVEAYLGKGA